jgi:hypothetical protein
MPSRYPPEFRRKVLDLIAARDCTKPGGTQTSWPQAGRRSSPMQRSQSDGSGQAQPCVRGPDLADDLGVGVRHWACYIAYLS